MTETPDACYVPLSSRTDDSGRRTEEFLATPHTASAWNGADQHGGPVAALLTRALEQCEAREQTRLSRITVEILGGVPVGEVALTAWVERPGRRIELIRAEMSAAGPDGQRRTVAAASAWRLRTTPTEEALTHAESPLPPAPPQDAPGNGASVLPKPWQAGFVLALDWHPCELPGAAGGPSGAWLRMRHPLVAGEETTPTQRAMAVADTANGVGARIDTRQFTFLNTELTVHLYEPPTGVWVGLRAETSAGRDGVGLSAGTLHSASGPIGRVSQNLLVERRRTATGG